MALDEQERQQLALRSLRDCDDPRVFITKDGSLGLCIKGRVVVMPVERWHELALKCC